MFDSQVVRRNLHLRIFFLVILFAIALRAFFMQVIYHDYYDGLSERNRLRVIYLEGPRGVIYDRNNIPIVSNRLSYDLTVIPAEAKKYLKNSVKILAPILDKTQESLMQSFKKARPGALNTVVMVEDIDAKSAMAVEEALDSLPGFMMQTRPRREYPFGPSMAHISGYLGPMSEQEVDVFTDWYGYRKSQWIGKTGLEKHYESFLRGSDGGFQVEVDSRGRFKKYIGVKEPLEGKSLTLSVDSRLQELAYQLLDGKKATAIVMDLKDGGLLCMANNPSYDPDDFSNVQHRRQVGRYFQDSNRPLLNRAIQGQFPTGSIFKIVTAAAALTSGKISSDTRFLCPGYFMLGKQRFNCWWEQGHGAQTLSQALEHSCNSYFFRAGLASGFDHLRQKAEEFGYGQKTAVDLPGEEEGFLPSRQWKKRVKKEAWYDGETVNLSIGQGYLLATPMQALCMIALTATSGHAYAPHLVASIDDKLLKATRLKGPELTSDQWRSIQKGLEDVVNSSTGSGRLAKISQVKVAGKTGTAQSGQDQTHAWFVAYAPAENPKIALVVMVENGGRGGVAAARIAKPLLEWLAAKEYV